MMNEVILEAMNACAFWYKSSNESCCVFNGSFFPAVIRMTEVGLCVENLIGANVFGVFNAVVIGDGFSGILRKGHEPRLNGDVRGPRCAIFNFCDLHEPAFAFDKDIKSGAVSF